MKRWLYALLGVSSLVSSALAADPIVPDGLDGWNTVVRPFLAKHCYDCHGDADGEGGVDLTRLPAEIETAVHAGHWLSALEQLQAGLMPPLKQPRPDSRERARVVHWIEKTVLASGRGEAYRRKTMLPRYGNLVDHGLLFSGEIKSLPYTPARVWRRSPYIFAGSIKGVGKAKTQNPYTYSTPKAGVRDYAKTSFVGSSVVETIVLNANENDRDTLVDVSLDDHKLPEICRPFAGMKNRLTILQGLSGNNLKGNHTAGFGTLSGRNSELTPVGPSVDALLGLRHSTGPYPMFGFATNGVLRGQASVPDDAYVYPTMSAYKKGQAVAYQASPTKAFNELFGSAVLPPDKLQSESIIKRNLMDFLKDDASRIRKRLAADDREQFDGYIDTFESLKVREQRKALLKNRIKTYMPDYQADKYTRMQHMPRMESQLEMGTAALIAGLTNVVSYRLDTLGSMYQDLGIGSMGLHAIGHGGESNGFTSVEMRGKIDAYHLRLIHRMASKFDAIPEADTDSIRR